MNKNIWISIGLTIFIPIVLYCALPDFIPKYRFELSEKVKSSNKQDYYHDLNNDGLSEYITLLVDQFASTPALCIYPHYDRYGPTAAFFQITLKRYFVSMAKMQFVDFDNDRIDELFFFTRSRDSLFLEWNSYDEPVVHSKYVGQVCVKNDKEDFEVFFGESVDLNNDGFKEVLFVVSGAHCGINRYVAAFDPVNDSLYKCPKSFINYRSYPDVYKDPDNKVYMAVPTHATNNYKQQSDLLTDSASYVVVFDNELNYAFDPIASQGYSSFIQPFFASNDTSTQIFCSKSFKEDSLLMYEIDLYDLSGNLLVSRPIREKFVSYGIVVTHYNNKDHLYTWQNARVIKEYNFSLNEIRTIDFPWECRVNETIDIDNDGNTEIILQNKNTEKLYLAQGDFSNLVELDFPYSPPYRITIKKNEDKHNQLAIDTNDYLLLINYYPNPDYLWKIPFFLLVGIFLYLSFFLYKKMVIESRLQKEKVLAKIQLTSLRNQIDPHFTLNVLNSISGMYNSQQMDEADKYLSRYSKLMQQSIVHGNEVDIKLKEELQFIRDYIEVQKFRFDNCFGYEILVDENVNLDMKVPRLLIHTFVENAIKHGILPKKGNKGMLKVLVNNNGKSTIINVEDNGIGRVHSKQMKTGGTGKGLELISESLELYRKLAGKKITFDFEDIDQNDETGTTIIIKVPN